MPIRRELHAVAAVASKRLGVARRHGSRGLLGLLVTTVVSDELMSGTVHPAARLPPHALATNLACICLLLTLGLVSGIGRAFDFTPTDAEWQAWPAYCRARYVQTTLGRESVFASRISPDQSQRWEATVGPEAWYALHHFCGGLVRIERAGLLPDKDKRKSEIGYGVDEFNFFLQRTPEQHPLYAEALVRICMARGKQGQPEAGLAECDRAIAVQPGNSMGYSAKATVLRRQKKLAEARAVLEEGNRATEGNSAEVHYFLGLTCADLGDYTCAVEHARLAYALGYPLPGLRSKLQAAGHPL